MIWIVSNRSMKTEDELRERHKYICEITKARTTEWQKNTCTNENSQKRIKKDIGYYKCKSCKGEYGIVITAHNDEVISIVKSELSRSKKAYIFINSCKISDDKTNEIIFAIKEINKNSEVFFAVQEKYMTSKSIYEFNIVDNLGTFGFETTKSERELFRNRNLSLMKALSNAYERVEV